MAGAGVVEQMTEAELAAVEAVKQAATVVYKEAVALEGDGEEYGVMRDKFDAAIAKYSEALGLMREVDADDDDEIEALRGSAEARMRAVLLSNRAQCHLKIGQKHPDGVQSKEARKAFMKANMDASFASELAPDYSKALYRKGLSLLGMPDTNARSKEAVMALKQALTCADCGEAMAGEVRKMLEYAQQRRFEGVDMPENCCVQ